MSTALPPPFPDQRSRTGSIALVLLVAAAIGVLAFFVFGSDDEGDGIGSSSSDPTVVSDSSSGATGAETSSPESTTESTTESGTSDTSTVETGSSTDAGTSEPAWFSMGGYGFFDVPVLGATDVRGSGCGSGDGEDPTLGDTLPDGLWFGSLGPQYEDYEPIDDSDLGYGYKRFDGATLEIDLWCVYSGATAEQKFVSEACQSDIECEANNSTGWLTEDESNRLRSLPVAANFTYRVDYYEAEAGWYCMWTDPFEVGAAWRLAPVWIAVNDGRVTEIFGHCAYYLESDAPR